LNPGSIWYTPISGIWQTVWLELVNENHITKLEINHDYDSKEVKITFKLNSDEKLPLNVKLEFDEKEVKTVKGKSNEEITIKVDDEDFHPWSPSEPNLYIIKAELLSGDDVIDSIESYTTIRKIEQRKDSSGIFRIFLNDKPLFNMGTLDQGFWPDGLYTPPSEEAMIYDIQKLKDFGFNTIRKHIKIEPWRYYYQCDKIGMLLWQDMPSGDLGGNKWEATKLNEGTDVERSDDSKKTYYKEWEEIIDHLKFFQCIIIWVPFNEAWGQFDTEKVVEFTHEKDPLRLINAASGGNHRVCGNFIDFHSYPGPNQFFKEETLINVLGEYGGLGLDIKGHTWKDDNWGYAVFESKEDVTKRYEEYIDELIKFVDSGFSGAIYTQTTDVESEINGLITYDREEIKIIEERIKAANEKLIESLKE
jgi:beta-galactosidase/beta-glucuronidase